MTIDAFGCDSRNRHHHLGHLGWGRVRPPLARRFHASADRLLLQVEIFGRYLEWVVR